MAKKKYMLLAAVAFIGVALSLYAGSKPLPPPKPQAPKVPLPAVLKPTVVSSVDHKTISFKFPYRRPGTDGEILDFNFQVDYKQGESTLFHIIPDDCLDTLEINDKKIELTGEANEKRCEWHAGFNMDWKPYLKVGVNNVHIVIRNIGGWVGLYFLPIRP